MPGAYDGAVKSGPAHGFVGAVALAVACSPAHTARPGPAPAPMPGPCALPPAAPAALALQAAAPELLACFDLPPTDARSHELSGLAWDPAVQRLYAVSDRNRTITVLVLRPDLAGFDLAPSIPLDIDLPVWDGEAIAIAGDRFLVVANESPPAIFSVDRAGHDARPLALPFRPGMRHNLGIEGIGYAAAGARRYVFTVHEAGARRRRPGQHGRSRHRRAAHASLARRRAPARGRVPDRSSVHRGVRRCRGERPRRAVDRARAHPGAQLGERRRQLDRVYAVDLRGAPSIAALDDARRAAPVAKRLVLDLATVDDSRCSVPPGPQRRKIYDNYEGLAVGPVLGDGRRVLFLVSDDNDCSDQLPRMLAVALAPGEL